MCSCELPLGNNCAYHIPGADAEVNNLVRAMPDWKPKLIGPAHLPRPVACCLDGERLHRRINADGRASGADARRVNPVRFWKIKARAVKLRAPAAAGFDGQAGCFQSGVQRPARGVDGRRRIQWLPRLRLDPGQNLGLVREEHFDGQRAFALVAVLARQRQVAEAV